jgi:glyoxylase-like metal-dependent hydrolase (beta-lactamase superfamily II)
MLEVYALHVGDRDTTRCQFLYRDPSHERLTISFYFWLVLGGAEPIVIDTSFDAAYAKRRGLRSYRDRTELLQHVGVDPREVTTVVMSHLHWDHCAGHSIFPRARLIVQKQEIEFWNGDIMRYEAIASSGSAPTIEELQKPELVRRTSAVNGDFQLAPGLEIYRVPGHTPGMQIVTAETSRGTVVLANDTMHYYENLERRRPVQVTMDMPGALRALDTVEKLAAGNPELIVPGHDPAVADRFETIAPGIIRIA